ncbi:MAG: electron transfer flavoprotein subunit alpha/FixB family protein, partial [Candidatus Nitrosothermus koennekii]
MRYQHLVVVFEHDDGNPLRISYEMLGEARRLMDYYNKRYNENEKVIVVILGYNIKELAKEAIYHGADAVIYADHPELRYVKNNTYTKVISDIVRDKDVIKRAADNTSDEYIKPRYMLFGADSIGRHLSATVLAELDSGLASDVNKLVIDDIVLRHTHKTKGREEKYERTLIMYRPDFSGFLWTQILCLDNRDPENKREFHPQACSVIPNVFEPLERDENREGIIIEYKPKIEEKDLLVNILNRQIIKSEVPLEEKDVIVAFGRGIKDDPENNIRLIEELAKELNAEIGISLPLSKQPYNVSSSLKKYFIADRV